MLKSWPAPQFYKGKTCYGTGYEMIDEIDRLRGLLGRYSDHVEDAEGSAFLDPHEGDSITEQEAAEIRSYSPHWKALADKEATNERKSYPERGE